MSVDYVNHPPHYKGHPKGIECIEVIEDNPFLSLGNAMKYLWRVSWGSKGRDVEDLRKAVWYIEREITRRTAAEATEDTKPLFEEMPFNVLDITIKDGGAKVILFPGEPR